MGSRKAKQNELVYIPFTIFDSDGETPLSGQMSSCSYNLTLNDANAPESVGVIEIESSGYYYATFTPLSLGTYDLEITCPDGRVVGETLFVEINDLDDIVTEVDANENKIDALALEANVEGYVTNALNTYDPPTRAEATADKNEILAAISTESLKISRVLGLSQENFVMSGHSWQANAAADGYLLVGCTIKTYPTAADANADTNEIAEYVMSATYDGSDRITNYKVVLV